MSPPEKVEGPAINRALSTTITTTTGNDSGAVMFDMPVMSVTVPPTEASMGLAVNAMAANREPIHWWLRAPAGQPQVAFLKAMGWWS